ncbi:MAG: MarC family protein [bacterium]|nr:MarC family protein [bacterium]
MLTFDSDAFIQSATLFFVLFNPFLMSIYLMDLIQDLDSVTFAKVLARATGISLLVFYGFALGGEGLFRTLFQVDFASFMIFGGVIFLIISLRYIFKGSEAIVQTRGPAEHLAGGIAMPFMIGPGTISASVWAGNSLGPLWAMVAITVSIVIALVALWGIKLLYDREIRRDSSLVERYVDITGRASALVIGSFAVQMIMTGLKDWGFFVGKT